MTMTAVPAGIRLHREIDQFTTIMRPLKAKEYFRPVYRLYSGALGGCGIHHFLAIEPSYFQKFLFAFSQKVYAELDKQQAI